MLEGLQIIFLTFFLRNVELWVFVGLFWIWDSFMDSKFGIWNQFKLL